MARSIAFFSSHSHGQQNRVEQGKARREEKRHGVRNSLTRLHRKLSTREASVTCNLIRAAEGKERRKVPLYRRRQGDGSRTGPWLVSCCATV